MRAAALARVLLSKSEAKERELLVIGPDWQTEHIQCVLLDRRGSVLLVSQVTTDEPKVAMNEAADIALKIGNSLRKSRLEGNWNGQARLRFQSVGHPLGQMITDQIRDELVDMEVLAPEPTVGGYQVIAPGKPKKTKPKGGSLYTAYTSGQAPTWKNVHSVSGHTSWHTGQ